MTKSYKDTALALTDAQKDATICLRYSLNKQSNWQNEIMVGQCSLCRHQFSQMSILANSVNYLFLKATSRKLRTLEWPCLKIRPFTPVYFDLSTARKTQCKPLFAFK